MNIARAVHVHGIFTSTHAFMVTGQATVLRGFKLGVPLLAMGLCNVHVLQRAVLFTLDHLTLGNFEPVILNRCTNTPEQGLQNAVNSCPGMHTARACNVFVICTYFHVSRL